MRRCLVLWAPLTIMISTATQAQTLGVVEQRLDRLEQAVRKIERKTGKLREADSTPQGETPQKPNNPTLLLELNSRLQKLEQMFASQTSASELERRAVAGGLDQLQRFKGDAEQRLDGMDQLLSKLAALVEAAKQAPPPSQPSAKVMTAEDRYLEALGYAERREWTKAEFAFDTFIAANPAHARVSEARYWLGRSFYGQGKVAQAAQIFLDLFEKQPSAPFALDNLFALGQSLVDLGPENAEQACAVYDQIESGFKDKLSTEQRNILLDIRVKTKCKS